MAKASVGFPLPGWLSSLFGGGAAVGAGVATKAVAVTAVSLLVAGGSFEASRAGHKAVSAVPAQMPAPAYVASHPEAAALVNATKGRRFGPWGFDPNLEYR